MVGNCEQLRAAKAIVEWMEKEEGVMRLEGLSEPNPCSLLIEELLDEEMKEVRWER